MNIKIEHFIMQVEVETSDCQCHIFLWGPLNVDLEKSKELEGMIYNQILGNYMCMLWPNLKHCEM
jgi:hypothetical protein